MKRLFANALIVLAALVGFIVVLFFLPANPGSCGEGKEGDCHRQGKCHDTEMSCPHQMHDGGDMASCHGKEMKCGGGMESCQGNKDECMKEWKDADGKMHKEIRIEIHGDGKEGCGMHEEMESGCGGMNMHGGCCCCCRMMMMGGGMHQEMMKDSMQLDTTVRVKIRGKM